jgi:hypothetical protein
VGAPHFALRAGHPGSADCTFKQEGAKPVGGESSNPASGEVNGQRVTFQIKSGEVTATYRADLDPQGKSMKGTWRLVDAEKKARTSNFEAKKKQLPVDGQNHQPRRLNAERQVPCKDSYALWFFRLS